jgi:hypothetical protein
MAEAAIHPRIHLKSTFLILSACAVMLLTGCDSPTGSSTGMSYLLTTDETVDLRQLVRVARVIGPYQQLTAADMQRIRTRLQDVLDDLVSVEIGQMEREEKARVKAGKPPSPPRTAEQMRQTARERVLARLGKDLALPLLTSDNRSAVAFGKVTGTGLEVTATAYEVDLPRSELKAGTTVKNAQGAEAKVVGGQP